MTVLITGLNGLDAVSKSQPITGHVKMSIIRKNVSEQPKPTVRGCVTNRQQGYACTTEIHHSTYLYFPKSKSGTQAALQRIKTAKEPHHVLIFSVNVSAINRLTNVLTGLWMKPSSKHIATTVY